MDTLFPLGDPEFDRDRLQEHLQGLAARGIRIGSSSWKYQGWLGQIYSRSRYMTRGRFSRKLFEESCLEEYVSIFPTVCGDFAFYQFPSVTFWTKLFHQSPAPFLWGFKVPEQITVPAWPEHPRYRATAGKVNPDFLNAELLNDAFLKPLDPFRQRVGVLIFEFASSSSKAFSDRSGFFDALDRFLSRLPPGWRYAVEVRDDELLSTGYFELLRAYNVPHVFNGWTRMPQIGEQFALPGSLTSDIIVTRALLRRDRSYEQAVQAFSPYDRIRDVNPAARKGLREIIDFALADGRPAFIFVNNRLEGNSPMTIVVITD